MTAETDARIARLLHHRKAGLALGEPVVPPGRHRADVPADLQAVVLRCLDKDPARRFPNADTLDQALSQCRCAGRWTRAQAAAWWQEHGEDKEPERS